MIGVGKLGQDCAEVMALHYDVVGYDVVPRTPTFPMKQTIQEAVQGRDLIFIAAPTGHDPIYGGETPTSHLPNKDFDYTIVTGILTEVNKYVTKDQLVVLISTVLPGTVRNILEPCITNARFIYNPYLIAMGTTKWDMINPEMVIIGTDDGDVTADAKILTDFYRTFMENDPRYEIGTWDEAEAIKIFYNTFISTKVVLVNMIQDVAETNGNINVDVVTGALKRSTQRITGPSYMTAAMSDGGACHPRDNIALRFLADRLELGYDLFDAIMKAREVQAERMALRCLKNGKNVTIIGKAYKPGVPYLNGSGSLLLGHYIEKHGGSVNYYDINTGDTDLKPLWTHVYLIGYWEDYVYQALRVLPHQSVVIDPWRRVTPADTGANIIRYGDTRPNKEKINEGYEGPDYSGNRHDFFNDNFPQLKKYEDKIMVLNAHFYMNNTPEFIVQRIRQAMAAGRTKIVFSCPGEALLIHQLLRVHHIIGLIPELPAKDIFYVGGGIDDEAAYINYANVNDIPSEKRINVISIRVHEMGMSNNARTMFGDNYEVKLKEKDFVCLNRVHRDSRLYMLGKMFGNGLVNQSYYSFEGDNTGTATTPDQNSFTDAKYWIGTVDWTPFDKMDPEIKNQIYKNIDLLPLRLNITADRQNPVKLEMSDEVYHANSYFSVVTETHFYNRENQPTKIMSYYAEDGIFLTEKTFRPIALLHPFILASFYKSLQALHDLGYKTFAPFIDESYDSEEDDNKRLDMVIAEVERLCKFTDEQWIEWQRNIKEIVEHNHNVLVNKTYFSKQTLEELEKKFD